MESIPLYNPKSNSDTSQIQQRYGLTQSQLLTLQSHSTNAKSAAYCPYSQFRVGASIITQDGQVIDGANVENAAYPVGTCAERVAIAKAVTGMQGGFRKGVFRALAVATDISPPASPCGMCRQFIREFCDLTMPILMFDKEGNFYIMKLEQLLPLSFGPEALPPPTRSAQSPVGSDRMNYG